MNTKIIQEQEDFIEVESWVKIELNDEKPLIY
jgi:hypothetical protein